MLWDVRTAVIYLYSAKEFFSPCVIRCPSLGFFMIFLHWCCSGLFLSLNRTVISYKMFFPCFSLQIIPFHNWKHLGYARELPKLSLIELLFWLFVRNESSFRKFCLRLVTTVKCFISCCEHFKLFISFRTTNLQIFDLFVLYSLFLIGLFLAFWLFKILAVISIIKYSDVFEVFFCLTGSYLCWVHKTLKLLY